VNWEKRRLERIIKMDLLGNIGEKVGLGNVDLDNIKKQASFFLRDKINSARLFLTDVTPSQLLTEEATNDEEWGPATKVMASIAEACCHMEDYPRVMQVLHGRLSLIGKKHWRQFLKTLTVVEYLLLHGPEEIALEFSSDRDLIEDLSRFNYVDDRMYGGSLTCLYEYQYTVL
jgi:epsin